MVYMVYTYSSIYVKLGYGWVIELHYFVWWDYLYSSFIW